MASSKAFSESMALLFLSFPNRKPQGKPEEIEAVLAIWERSFSGISDEALINAVTRFVMTTKKLFPDDNPMAMILSLAVPTNIETIGDCVELAEAAASRFGTYRGEEAMAWIESKSPLIAASIRRLGFREFCLSENPDVVRGQLRAIYHEEKVRAEKIGGVVRSAVTDLENGKLPLLEGPNRFAMISKDLADKKKLPA